MKKSTLFFIPFILFFTACIAQQRFDQPEVKADRITFVCKQIGDLSYNRIRVYNRNNSLEEIQKGRFGELSVELRPTPKGKFSAAFWDVFGKEKLEKLVLEKNIPISLYIDKNGNTLELSYSLDKNTIITPKELEKLELNLKKVSSDLRPEYIVKGEYFFLVFNASFQKILYKEY